MNSRECRAVLDDYTTSWPTGGSSKPKEKWTPFLNHSHHHQPWCIHTHIYTHVPSRCRALGSRQHFAAWCPPGRCRQRLRTCQQRRRMQQPLSLRRRSRLLPMRQQNLACWNISERRHENGSVTVKRWCVLARRSVLAMSFRQHALVYIIYNNRKIPLYIYNQHSHWNLFFKKRTCVSIGSLLVS